MTSSITIYHINLQVIDFIVLNELNFILLVFQQIIYLIFDKTLNVNIPIKIGSGKKDMI